MFGSAAKTPFGTGSTFGTGTSAFGQSTATPFGQTSTTLFGSKPATNLFGQTSAADSGGLFGSTNTSTGVAGLFGGGASVFKQSIPTTQATGFGFGGLGSTAGQTQTNIFGTPQQTPVFGTGTTSGFGTSGSLFGPTAATSKPGGLFGTTATTQSSSLFGGGTTGLTTGFSGFGTSATATVGTPLKFNVVSGTDQLVKNGVSTNVGTRHQCITVMKEYESKSLEELRMEDYQAGRKGGSTAGTLTTSTAGGLFGGTATSQTGGLFGSTPGFASGTTLAQTQPGFGGAKGTSFGTGTSLFGQQSQQTGGLFGKSGSLFAPTSTATAGTSAFGTTGFGATGTTGGLFGQTASATPSLFGATTTTQPSTGLFGATGSIFGQPASSTGTTLFGQSTFGQPAQTGGLFGAKPAGTAFGTTLGTPNPGGLFGAQKTTGFNFGQTGTTGLGTTGFGTAGTTSLFGNKPIGFGTGTMGTTLGAGTTTGLFGATTGLGGTSALGATGFGTLGGLGTQTASGLGAISALGGNQNAALLAQQQQELQRQVLALASSPFGDSPLFRNSLLDKSKVERASTTTTSTQRLGGSPSHYKVMPRPAARIKPRPINSTTMNKSKLFEGLDDDSGLSPDTFVPRRSIKKLIIKKNTGSEDSSPVAHVDGNSRLSSLEDSEELGVSTPPYMASHSPARALRTTPTRSVREGLDVVDSSEKESGTPIGVRFSGVARTARLDDTIADLNVQSRQDGQVAVVNDTSQGVATGRVDQGTMVAMVSPSGRRPSEPCGITLTRPDYFCIPSVDELNSQIDEKGEIWVKDFIVVREGYGQAKFLGWTNVAGLDLDAIITFRRREIEVYPDNYAEKPAVGEELNKKSEITLEKVWPNDKSTHQPIRSPERLKLQGWQERIEKATATLGAVFYDYQMDTGKWVFTVEHFTRYGMHEELEDESALKKLKRQPIRAEDQQFDDNMDEEKLILLKKLREQQEKLLAYEEERQKMSSSLQHDDSERLVLVAKIQEQEEKLRAYEMSRRKADVAADRDSDMEDIGNETFPDEMLDEEDEIEQSPASHRLANSLGVNAHRMQVMKASFFGEDDHHRPHAVLRETIAKESVVRESSIVGTPLATLSHMRPFQSLDSPGPTLSPRVPRIVQNTTAAGRIADSLFGSPKIGAYPVRHVPSRFTAPPSPMLLPSAIGSPFDTGIKIVGACRQRAPVPKHNSLTANKEHLIADMGLTMGRSFRVGWGPGLTLVHSGRTLSNKTKRAPREARPADGMEFLVPKPSRPAEGQGDGQPFRVTLERVDVAPHLTEGDRVVLDQHESALDVELNCSQWTLKDGCPMFEPCPGTRALHHHAQTARKNMEALVSGPMAEDAEQMSLVWDLAVALWGRLGDPEDDDDDDDDDDDEESENMDRDEEINTEQRDSYESQMARREALSKWLEFAAKKRIKQEVDQTDFQERNYLRMILSYLSGRQISAACQAAQQKGDYRLALLLSQVAGSSEFRHLVRRQLGDWEQTKADKFIKEQRMKIYALLAGVMVWRMSREEVNVCEGLDWKRCFAVHLWYFCSAKSSIQDALKAYEDAFKGRTTHGRYSCAPLPPHMESSTQATEEEGEDEAGPAAVRPRDTCYHLLKLYCKRSHRLERALAPSTSTARQLDYRLSWHLNQALESLGYTHLSEYHTGVLHSSFASQLENLGIWEWSVFVLLHIKDRVRRECAVRDILCRHCRLSQDEEYLGKEWFVRDKLHVPAQWIHEAKALRAHAEKCPYEEAFHLLKASHWNLGHNVILKNLASEAIVNEEYDTLKKLLGELQPRERNSTVKRWATGGQVFLDYLVLLEKVQAIAQGAQESSRVPSKYELEQIHMDVSSLCSRINHVPCANVMDRLCQSEMAKMCTNFLKMVSKELMEHDPEEEAHLSTHVLAPHVNKLPMPEDCLLVELQELTAAYVTEVACV